MPVSCSLSTATTSLQNFVIKVCDTENSGSQDDLVIELENSLGHTCRTNNLTGFTRGSFKTITLGEFDKTGKGCKNFEVTKTTFARVYNAGNDDLCITDLQLDVVNKKEGMLKHRTKLCYYDFGNQGRKFQDIHVVGVQNIPLVCS